MKNRSGILRGITLIFAFALLLPCICPSVEAHGFTDVSYGSIYFDAVSYCYDNGIIVGITETQFCPNQDLNRAMFITFLYRMAGEPQEFADVNFTDVPEGRYFTDAVRWGVHEGIVVGMTDTQFAPFNPLNQEMVITFLHRFAKSTRGYAVEDRDGLDSSDSAGISNFAKKAMYWASISGVLYISNNELTPKVTVTRGEAARYLWRFASNVDGIIPGTDDFSFVNDPASSFSVTTHYGITQAHLNKLMSKLTTSEQFAVTDFQNTAVKSGFGAGGMCYGMSVCTILDKLGKIDFNGNFCRNADTLSSVPRPASSTSRNIWGTDYELGTSISWSESAINYYHLSMFATATVGFTGQGEIPDHLNGSPSENLKLLAREQQNGGLALFTYKFFEDNLTNAHTVVIYGKPSKTTIQLNGKSYYWYPIYDSRYPGAPGRLCISTDFTACKVRKGNTAVYEDATDVWYFNDKSKRYDNDNYYTEGFDDDNFATFDSIDIDGIDNGSPNALSTEVMSSAITPNLRDCIYLFIQADGDYTITNAEGESFSSIDGEFTKSMDADCVAFYPGIPCMQVFRIPCSSSFSMESESRYLSLTYLTAEDSMAVHGSGIEQIDLSADGLLVLGTNMHYSVGMILDPLKRQSVQVTGSNESTICLSRQSGTEIHAQAQDASCEVAWWNFRDGTSLAVQSLEAGQPSAIYSAEGIYLVTEEVQ